MELGAAWICPAVAKSEADFMRCLVYMVCSVLHDPEQGWANVYKEPGLEMWATQGYPGPIACAHVRLVGPEYGEKGLKVLDGDLNPERYNPGPWVERVIELAAQVTPRWIQQRREAFRRETAYALKRLQEQYGPVAGVKA